ncbi:MAG TPA: class F sortase [Mycobacteriales bacterium]|nr:class F sortase [Mycobacteriales bacterium]
MKRIWTLAAVLAVIPIAGCSAKNVTVASAAGTSTGSHASASGPSGTPSSSPAPFKNKLGTHPAKLSDLQKLAARAPVKLVIPALGVNAPIKPVGTDPKSGQLELPPSVDSVAWWSYGARPGDRTGTVVLAAHVDYNGRYGLFFHLRQLAPGATATVVTADGSTYRFRVTANQELPKPALPGQEVFRTTGSPRLALVTCGGDFNPAAKSYLDNVIAYAAPSS